MQSSRDGRRLEIVSRLRTHRVLGAYLFLAVMTLLMEECPLADSFLNRTAPGLEREESLTGDEVQVRVIAVSGAEVPTTRPYVLAHADGASRPGTYLPECPASEDASRAPPIRVSS